MAGSGRRTAGLLIGAGLVAGLAPAPVRADFDGGAFLATCPAEVPDEAASLCTILADAGLGNIRIVQSDTTTRIEGLPFGHGRLGAIEISNTLFEGRAVLWEIVDGHLRVTGLRDLSIAVETGDRRVAVNIGALDAVQIDTVRTETDLHLRIVRESSGVPMTWRVSETEHGDETVLDTQGSDVVDVRAHAETNHVSVSLRSEGGHTVLQDGDVVLDARDGRPAYLDLTYHPGSSQRATEAFGRLLLRDGVYLGPHVHLSQRGTLTFDGGIGHLEGSASFLLPPGSLPERTEELRGLMLSGGVRWHGVGGIRHAGIGLGILPISMLKADSDGATDRDGWLRGGPEHLEVPLSLVAQLYTGTTRGDSRWRYHIARYRNLMADRNIAMLEEPSEGGWLGAMTFESDPHLTFAAILASDDRDTSARFELEHRF